MLVTIGWVTTLYWVIRRWSHQRQAWQWWQQQQACQQHRSAESIRDGLLQQTFGLTRYLEGLSQAACSETISGHPTEHSADRPESYSKLTDTWVARSRSLYQSLEALSNDLSPPFVEDSLSLALQLAIKDWNQSRPELTIRYHLPSEWIDNSPADNRRILPLVMTLLTVLIPKNSSGQQLEVTLNKKVTPHDSQTCQLTFKLTCNLQTQQQPSIQGVELMHLKEIFHSLVTGRLDISKAEGSLICRLSWPETHTLAP